MKRYLTCVLLAAACAVGYAQPSTSAKSALVIDIDTNRVLFEKNDDVVRPIASITKLMGALVIAESGLSLYEPITITLDDVKAARPTGGSLSAGTTLTRGELLRLSLMSSQNRAAAALGRTYPGGMDAFIGAMNAKALELRMDNSHFTDPTGLYNTNVSTAGDLVKLAVAAMDHEVIREYSTTPSYQTETSKRTQQFNTTNGLVRRDDWEVLLQKTGYIADAGRCMVVITTVAARRVVMILLNTPSTKARQRDARGLKYWVEHNEIMPVKTKR